jgi:hypothetical protein
MYEILIFAMGAYIGYQIGITVLAWQLRDIIIKGARAEGIDISGSKETLVKQLYVEHENNMLFLYDRDANHFVCQGKSMDELAELSKRYSGIKYAAVIDRSTDNVIAFVDGKVDLTVITKIKI